MMNRTNPDIKELQTKILQRVHQYEADRIKRKKIGMATMPFIVLLFFILSLFYNNLVQSKIERNMEYVAETMDDYDLYVLAEDDAMAYNNDNQDDENCEEEYLANDPFLEFYLTENN